MVAVQISNFTIQAVEGRYQKSASVRRICEENLPVGLMSAGTVLNEEELAKFLAAFWAKHRLPKNNVILVMGGSQLLNKVIEAPTTMKENQLVSYFSREFTDFSCGGDTAFGCWTMKEKKEQKRAAMLATGADRGYLRSLVQVFARAGISLGDIVSELSGILCVLRNTRELKGKTAVVLHWNGINLTNVLVADGEYVYSDSRMLPYDPSSPAYAVGVARQVSQLQQFMKAQNMTTRAEQIYLVGMPDDALEFCTDSITQMDPTLLVDPLPGADAFRLALAPVGAMGINCGQMGLLAQLTRDPATLEARAKARKRLIPAAVMVILAAAVCVGTWLTAQYFRHQLTELQDYNNSEPVVRAVEEHNALQIENGELQAAIRGVERDQQAIGSYPAPDSSVNAVLRRCASGLVEIQLSGYSASSGVLSTVTTTRDVENMSYFVAVLSQEEIFSHVEYTGYSYNPGTDSWTGNVVCTLAPGAGK